MLCLLGLPLGAATITNIAFTSNSGSFINDTIAPNSTSPLAFTTATGLANPFLNNGDSTITLNYGVYYAIAFRNFGAHIGAGTVSFLLNGATPFSQAVTFPDPTAPSGNFADFALPGGDRVTISSTGLAGDRIRVVADGGGLTGDSAPDAFYLFTFSQGGTTTPEPGTIALFVSGLAGAVILRRRRA